jgi:hypothetical protein
MAAVMAVLAEMAAEAMARILEEAETQAARERWIL